MSTCRQLRPPALQAVRFAGYGRDFPGGVAGEPVFAPRPLNSTSSMIARTLQPREALAAFRWLARIHRM